MKKYECLEFGFIPKQHCYTYFQNIYDARLYSYNKTHVKVYYIPGNEFEIDSFVDIYNKSKYITTYYQKKINAVMIIEKWYKLHFKKRMDSIIFLQCALRKAIANPGTKLCQKRLLREFNELLKYN